MVKVAQTQSNSDHNVPIDEFMDPLAYVKSTDCELANDMMIETELASYNREKITKIYGNPLQYWKDTKSYRSLSMVACSIFRDLQLQLSPNDIVAMQE